MEICTITKTDLSNEANPDSSKVSDPPSTQIRASRTIRRVLPGSQHIKLGYVKKHVRL